MLDGGVMRKRCSFGEVLDAPPAAASTEGQNQGGLVAGADDRVRRSTGAVEEIPGLQRPFVSLHQQQTLACDDEEALLV
jgi:hypothetical protein